MYVVDGEADSEAVETEFALGSSVLLHQGHNDCTFVVIIVILTSLKSNTKKLVIKSKKCSHQFTPITVRILQSDAVLRIHVERLWNIGNRSID